MASKLDRAFYSRLDPEKRSAAVQDLLSTSDTQKEIKSEDDQTALGHDAVSDKIDVEKQENAKGKAKKKPVYNASLLMAMHSVWWKRWWIAGFFYLASSVINATIPLVTKVVFLADLSLQQALLTAAYLQIILNWLVDAYAYRNPTTSLEAAAFGIPAPRGIGYGVGLAFALFVMQEASSFFNNHYSISTFHSLPPPLN